MKSRKTTIKKPKFLIPYFISVIILLLLFLGAAVIICMPWFFEYEYDLEAEASSKQTDLYSFFKETLDKDELTTTDLATVKSVLTEYYSETGQRSEIVIDGSYTLDSSRTAILIYSYEAEDGEQSYKYLQLADSKYLKYFDTEEVKSYAHVEGLGYSDGFHHSPTVSFECRKFYADYDKGLFIPVEAEILNWNSDPTGITVKIEPENTEGFTFVDVAEVQPHYSKADICGYEAAGNEETVEWTYDEFGNTHHSFKLKTSPMKAIHFYEANKYKLDFAILLVCCAPFIFAFIPATIIYNNGKRRYEIFEYRLKMVDAMAHDLKTPMAAISAYAENLSNHIGTDKQEYYAGKVEEKVAQMNRMVNDILEFSKSERQTADISKEDVDIGDVIAELISDNELMIKERSLKIGYEKKSIVVKTDRKLFRMALANLINNAVIYSKEGTQIDISLDEKDLIIINISEEKTDNAEDLKDPFVKGRRSRGSGGTGLGLAIANNNLAMLGYKLEIKIKEDKFIAAVKL